LQLTIDHHIINNENELEKLKIILRKIFLKSLILVYFGLT